jgi:hypothetical protein
MGYQMTDGLARNDETSTGLDHIGLLSVWLGKRMAREEEG